MEFHGEFYDTLILPDTDDRVCSAQTTELQEWIRTHPAFRSFRVFLGSTGARISVDDYLALPNVTQWLSRKGSQE